MIELAITVLAILVVGFTAGVVIPRQWVSNLVVATITGAALAWLAVLVIEAAA